MDQGPRERVFGEGALRTGPGKVAAACPRGRGQERHRAAARRTKARVVCAAWPSRTEKVEPELANV